MNNTNYQTPTAYHSNSLVLNSLPEYLNNIKIDSIEDRVYGCIFGQLIGDALGSYLEYTREQINEDVVNIALNMPGGGIFNLSPGQVTDDSEMATCILTGLCQMEEYPKFSLEPIAEQYSKWFNSKPFDICVTIGKSIKSDAVDGSYSLSFTNKAKEANQNSLSNGTLMRASPLALYAALNNLDFKDLKRIVTQDVCLTHPNQLVVDATISWVYLLQQLILGDNSQTLKKKLDSIHVSLNYQFSQNKVISEWLQKVLKKEYYEFKQQNRGYLGIPWVAGFILLGENTEFPSLQKSMKFVLSKGGDTDTNGCIVGSLIGAAIGFKAIYQESPEWIKKILLCSPNLGRDNYRPQIAIEKTKELIEKKTMPSNLSQSQNQRIKSDQQNIIKTILNPPNHNQINQSYVTPTPTSSLQKYQQFQSNDEEQKKPDLAQIKQSSTLQMRMKILLEEEQTPTAKKNNSISPIQQEKFQYFISPENRLSTGSSTRKRESFVSFKYNFPLPKYLQGIKAKSKEDRYFGCIIGQLIGDALQCQIDNSQGMNEGYLNNLLEMNGDGPNELSSGQIGGDSELSMALLDALLQLNKDDVFKLDFVASRYLYWFKTEPFFIGTINKDMDPIYQVCILNGSIVKNTDPSRIPKVSHILQERANIFNYNQLSWRCLARQAPLGIYSALKGLSFQQIQQIVNSETSLTHSNPLVQKVSTIWVYTLSLLLQDKRFLNIATLVQTEIALLADVHISKWWSQFEDHQYQTPGEDEVEEFKDLKTNFLTCFFSLNDPRMTFREHIVEIVQKQNSVKPNVIGALIGAKVGFLKVYEQNKLWVDKILQSQPFKDRYAFKSVFALDKTNELIKKYTKYN